MTNQSSEFTNNYETTVTTELSSTGTSLQVADASGLAVPCFLTLDWDDPAKLEIVRVTSKVSNTLTVTRYLAGSAQGSGLTHLVNANVKEGVVAQMFEDLHDRVEGHDHTGGAGGTTLAHGGLASVTSDQHHAQDHASRHATAGADPIAPGDIGAATSGHNHTGTYAPAAEGVTNGDSHDHSGGDGAQIDHGGLGGLLDDDHTNLLNETRHDALDHTGLTGVGGGETTVIKTADETLTSAQTTMQDDDHLTLAVGANEIWAIELWMWVEFATGGDTVEIEWTIPAGAAGLFGIAHSGAVGNVEGSDRLFTEAQEIAAVGTATANAFRLAGILDTAGTAGNVQLRWRNSKGLRDITVKRGSFIVARQLV